MKRLTGDALLEDLNLERGELVRIADTVYFYCGVVERDGRQYDKIIPVADLPPEDENDHRARLVQRFVGYRV
jgi:hypothetical protein